MSALLPAGLFLAIALRCSGDEGKNLGREVCAGCHRNIASTQVQTAMARTWQGVPPKQLALRTAETQAEGPAPDINYFVRRMADSLSFDVQLPGQRAASFPVEIVMGGERHGFSFLARVHEIDGSTLARAPLVETRYLHYAPRQQLALSPGFPKEKPSNYETAIGRVLTPEFERKCLACHGAPRTVGTHLEAGVSCESCHGPGQAHLAKVAGKPGERGILNPRLLPFDEQMRPCAQCHAGFSKVQDAMPDDLLISDQVTALSNSECWRQSGGRITCVGCHDPHADAPKAVLVSRSEKTCLGCHSAAKAEHAALCPVNRTSGCIGCHMPDAKSSAPFIISDHWIRVHGDQSAPAIAAQPEWKSKVPPRHLFLRLLVVDDESKAAKLREDLVSGASFFDVARANSLDSETARNGGYLGDLRREDLDPRWAPAALSLAPGDISAVVGSDGKYFIIGRMPRNFREDAEALFDQAMDLRNSGRRQESMAGLLEALKVDPQLLRALTFLGISYGEAGNAQTAAGILSLASRLYPRDAGAHFNLGIAYGASGNSDELKEYQAALTIDPDYVPAYLNLGAALFNAGRVDEAIAAYRHGIEVNPLAASLHYSLSLALERVNLAQDAKAEMDLALKINPGIKESGNHGK